MKIGVLTGGGDCPGLNAAIRAVVRAGIKRGDTVIGVLEGWSGLIKQKTLPLTLESTSGLLPMGGTILGGSRTNPLKVPGGIKRSIDFFHKQKLDALISIGGEGTLKIASAFWKAGLPVVCIPKTIDNDTWGTDVTIGFDTAVQIATEAIDRLHSTAESHSRVMIVEVMGRHVGWIATMAGIAGGADAILTPEEPFEMSELLRIIRTRAKRGRRFSIVVMAEDAHIRMENGKMMKTPLKHDEYGDVKLGGISELLARELRKRTGSDVRVTILGHVQRGGSPTAYDRILATRLGVHAIELVHDRRFGMMAVFRNNRIEAVRIQEAVDKLKTVDPEITKVARVFFG